MKKLLFILIFCVAGYASFKESQKSAVASGGGPDAGAFNRTEPSNAGPRIASGRQLSGEGKVVKILPDDQIGSRHQKFILKLASGQTLLIVHNIDLAPRIASLRVGDHVAFNGEYEWNSKGGLVHWTHHDPAKRHPDGWLKHGGRTYQ